MPGRPDTAEIRQKQARDISERLWLASQLKALSPHRAFSVNDAVDAALFLTQKLFKTAGVRVRTELESEMPEVDAPMGHVEQALVNVLVNACEATSSGEVVTVGTELLRKDLSVLVRIRDTGEGMSAESIERAFEPFYSTKGRLGLGLSAARELLLGLGGDMEIESTAGEGTKVTLKLPAATRPDY